MNYLEFASNFEMAVAKAAVAVFEEATQNQKGILKDSSNLGVANETIYKCATEVFVSTLKLKSKTFGCIKDLISCEASHYKWADFLNTNSNLS